MSASEEYVIAPNKSICLECGSIVYMPNPSSQLCEDCSEYYK